MSASDTGTTLVIATIANIGDTVPVTILHAGPDTLMATPHGDTLALTTAISLTTTVLDARGLTIVGAPVSFVSSDPSVAAVTSAGVVSAVGLGTAIITAASGNATTRVPILVPPCGLQALVHANSFSLPIRSGRTEPSGSFDATGLFNGTGVLYGAGLVLGTSPQETVLGYNPANLAYGFADTPVCELSGPTTSHTFTRLTLAPGVVGPTGLRVTQETFADSSAGSKDFVLFRYTVLNPSHGTISGLRVGFMADWDLAFDFNGTDDLARIVTSPVGVELQEPDTISHPQVLGVTSLGAGTPTASAWLNGTTVTPADAYNDLGLPLTMTTIRGDVRMLLGRGTISLPPAGQLTLYFAIVGGNSRATYTSNVAAAQRMASTLGFP